MKKIGDLTGDFNYGLMPKFTTVHHPVRKKFDLSAAHYMTIDSIDQLSNNPDYPYCEMRKEKIADWLGISRSSVFDGVKIGIGHGFVEKNPDGKGERTTQKWIDEVKMYDPKKRR